MHLQIYFSIIIVIHHDITYSVKELIKMDLHGNPLEAGVVDVSVLQFLVGGS